MNKLADWSRALFLPVSALLIVAAALIVPLPVFAERPGTSLNLAECLTIDDPIAEQINGDVLLTFATFRRATLTDLLLSLGADDVLLRPVERVIPQDIEPSAYFEGQRQRFNSVGLTAAAVGLERAGFPRPSSVTGEGALIVRTLDGFPAAGVLEADDVVIGANGRDVHTSDELRALILKGNPVTLNVHRGGATEEVNITPIDNDVDGQVRPVIGAELQTVNPAVDLPVDVSIRAGRIGGPSAGLMIALDVYDTVAVEDLIAGRRVAGTGEINAAGEVGRIGAIALKVLAADRQDASIFLAPASQADAARNALPEGSDLRVIGVEAIDDAIEALRDLPAEDGELTDVTFRACADRVALAPH